MSSSCVSVYIHVMFGNAPLRYINPSMYLHTKAQPNTYHYTNTAPVLRQGAGGAQGRGHAAPRQAGARRLVRAYICMCVVCLTPTAADATGVDRHMHTNQSTNQSTNQPTNQPTKSHQGLHLQRASRAPVAHPVGAHGGGDRVDGRLSAGGEGPVRLCLFGGVVLSLCGVRHT